MQQRPAPENMLGRADRLRHIMNMQQRIMRPAAPRPVPAAAAAAAQPAEAPDGQDAAAQHVARLRAHLAGGVNLRNWREAVRDAGPPPPAAGEAAIQLDGVRARELDDDIAEYQERLRGELRAVRRRA